MESKNSQDFTFEDLFKFYLRRGGWKQKDLAIELHIDPATLSRRIKTPTSWNELDLHHVCKYLDLNEDEKAQLFEKAFSDTYRGTIQNNGVSKTTITGEEPGQRLRNLNHWQKLKLGRRNRAYLFIALALLLLTASTAYCRYKLDLISDFQVVSQFEEDYSWQRLEPGLLLYGDRKDGHPLGAKKFEAYPSKLHGQLVLQTANNDKETKFQSNNFITFVVNDDAMVYVIYITKNSRIVDVWLSEENGWELEDDVVITDQDNNEGIRMIRSKFFPAGSIVGLGANEAIKFDTSMYHVVVAPTE